MGRVKCMAAPWGYPAWSCQAAHSHLSGLVQSQADGDGRDEEDAEGIPVVVVSQPKRDAEGLETIIGVQCLEEGRDTNTASSGSPQTPSSAKPVPC